MKRGIVKLGFIGLSLSLVLFAGIPVNAQDEIQMGAVSAFSGPYASLGEDQARGTRFAIEEAGGKVLGKPITLTLIDTEAKPGVGARKVREAIHSKGIRYFNGAVSSGVALAISQVCKEEKAIYVTSVGADEVTGSECNRYTFRWSIPTYGAVQETVKPMIKMFPDAKKWYTVTPDYVFGHSLLNNAIAIFKEVGVEHVGNDMHPIGHTEFSGFVTKAMAAKSDVVIFFNFGKDTINALKQANNFGLGKRSKILVAWSSGLRDFMEIGPDASEGVYFGCQFWHTVDVPLTQQLNEIWQSKYNRFPSYPEASAYIMTKLQIMAIEKAGTTDLDAVIEVLKGMKYDGLTGPEEIQAFDNQVKKKYYLLRAKGSNEMKFPGDHADIISSGISTISQADSKCKME